MGNRIGCFGEVCLLLGFGVRIRGTHVVGEVPLDDFEAVALDHGVSQLGQYVFSAG